LPGIFADGQASSVNGIPVTLYNVTKQYYNEDYDVEKEVQVHEPVKTPQTDEERDNK